MQFKSFSLLIILICCFLLVPTILCGQTELREPDYIFIEDDVFIEIYQDHDSLRTNERYYEDFKLHDDFYSYKDLKAFKDEWDVEEGDLIYYSQLKPFSRDIEHKEIRYKYVVGKERYFHFLKNKWVHIYSKKEGDFFRYEEDTFRYSFLDDYEGKFLMIFGEGLGLTVFYYVGDIMDSYVERYPYSLWETVRVLINPYLTDSDGKKNILFEFGYGFEIRKKENKYGVYDLFLDKIVVDYVYDEIQLERNIIVRNGDTYGLLDYYGKELMPLEFKIISYCNDNLQYLTKEQELFYKNDKGELIRPEAIDYENWTPSYESYKKENPTANYDWKFIKKEDGFYLVTKKSGIPNELIEQPIQIQNWEQYQKLVFASGKSENIGSMYQYIFAEKPSGKYDMFYHDFNPNFLLFEKDIDNFKIKYLPYGCRTNYHNFYITIHKEGLVRIPDYAKGAFKYTSLDQSFGEYYRFTLPNGRKGWVHTEGNEYFDDE
ncbi:hypothetical protein [Dokdonia sp.]|uniref:hypothetical protein n=1 Tax=Dokdonia sp. TaxID=2024995 RepID=UPI00326626AA